MAEISLLGMFSGGGGISLLIMTIVQVLVGAGFIAFIAWFLSPILTYPYVLNIRSLANGVLRYEGRAYGKVVSDRTGAEKFKVWRPFKKSKFIETPPQEYNQACGRRVMVDLIRDNGGGFHPMKVSIGQDDDYLLLPYDKDIQLMAQHEIMESLRIYEKKNKLLELVPLLASAGFVIMIFVFMLVLNQQMGEVVSAMDRLVGALTAGFPT